MQLQQPQK